MLVALDAGIAAFVGIVLEYYPRVVVVDRVGVVDALMDYLVAFVGPVLGVKSI